MNKEQLIKELLQHDLNRFRFSVYATINEEGDMEYAYCLKGSKPVGYEIHLCDVGGVPCIEYNYEYLEFVIDDSIDEFYNTLHTVRKRIFGIFN